MSRKMKDLVACDFTAMGVGKSWGSSRKGKLSLLEPTIGNRCPNL